ncbi:MAG: MerR family transcriptional regulator [Bacteroidota bacterium]
MAISNNIQKLYYSIKEVSTKFAVSESALRSWEREFPNLNPKRNSAGDRKYTEKDLKEIELIIRVRKDKKLTVEGAKNYIKSREHKKSDNEDLINSLTKVKNFLTEWRNSIQ